MHWQVQSSSRSPDHRPRIENLLCVLKYGDSCLDNETRTLERAVTQGPATLMRFDLQQNGANDFRPTLLFNFPSGFACPH